MKFFDSLVHATSDGRWLGGDHYNASLSQLMREMDRASVDRACLVALAEHVDNQTVLRFAANHPDRLVPIGSINPVAMGCEGAVGNAVAALRSEGFAGLKLHSRLNGYDPLHERAVAAVRSAGEHGLPVLLDTLFRQKAVSTRPASDIVDVLARACPQTRIVLLHGGAGAMLDLFELVRMHANLILDLSCTILRYEGSSLDQDIRFVCRCLDQRVTIGSDFPEYKPADALRRIEQLTDGLPEEKRTNIMHGNLDRLFGL